MNSLRKRLTILSCMAYLMMFFHSPGAMAENCELINQTKTQIIHFAGDALTAPQDAPIGTVLYQSEQPTGYADIKCQNPASKNFFLNPLLGVPSDKNTFPLGNSGLSFRIRYTNQTGYFDFYLERASTQTFNMNTMVAGSYKLEIIKTAEVPLQSVIPVGQLGEYKLGDGVFAIFNLATPITLQTLSCETPSVRVAMGDDYRLQEFEKSGDAPRLIKFNIALNQCQRGINKITYQLKATSQIIDAQNGLIGLNAGSTAKGIGLKLMNDKGKPVAFDKIYRFSGFSPTGTNFTIPFFAAYYRLAEGRLEAGTADAEVAFIMSYL